MAEEKGSKGSAEDPIVITVDENRLLAAISYLNVLFLIPLLMGRREAYVRFHLKQGIVLFAVDVIAGAIVWVPLVGWLIGLFLVCVSIYGFLQALAGKKWTLPYVGKYAERIKL
jgi:uncharacterized membrane protein